jgi:hypothetical protein
MQFTSKQGRPVSVGNIGKSSGLDKEQKKIPVSSSASLGFTFAVNRHARRSDDSPDFWI